MSAFNRVGPKGRRRSRPPFRFSGEVLECRRLLAGLTIAQENALPGTPASEWDIVGAGDGGLQGFATDISVNQGQTVSFKIEDPSLASYHIDIYRLGYYGGMGARKVGTIPSSATIEKNQPNPLTNNTTGLVDAGNWTVSASWAVPADATSGIYIARPSFDSNGSDSHIVFIVRNDTDHSKMLFQTSDTTWQAYNDWGGNSMYTGNSTAAPGRAVKVSYNRPFNTRATSTEDWLFNAEYPMVRWLESNGYDVSYTTGVDSDRRGAEIREHQVFLSVGHDEYWSGAQRTNVEVARDAGVDLAFFSGNEVFWKTRWENSIDGSGTSYRTLVAYKETHANAKIDPIGPNVWTGTWRDPRFSPPADGGRPENALTGTLFMVNSGATTAIKVPAADGKMRFWRNTTVATQAAGATATLPTGTLGYEWDIDPDNGFRPAGSFRLSTTTVNNAPILTDYGSTFGSGTAVHNMTLHREPSGALVFGAGTVQWSWGLDRNHDRGNLAPDVRMQQATVNLFADMGVQPTTLQPGLVTASASTDVTAASAAIASPAAGATINPGTTVTISGSATDVGGVVAGVELSTDGGVTWHPANGRGTWTYTWTPNTPGQYSLRARAVDDSGNLQNPAASVAVTVPGQTGNGTQIWSSAAVPSVPADPDTASVEVGVKLRSDVAGFITGIRFYKGSGNTGTHVGHLWSQAGSLLASATFTGETATGWQQVNFATPVSISANTVYVASYLAPSGRYAADARYFTSAGVDSAPLHALADGVSGGNGVYTYGTSAVFPSSTFQATNYWVDVKFAQNTSDVTPPTVTARTPAPGATGVAMGTTVTGTFSESVQSSTISFVLTNPSGTSVTASTSYADSTRVVTLTPAAPLAPSTTYTATLSGAKDLAGNAMSAPVSWTFTTVAADVTPPTVTAQSPAAGSTGVAVGTTVSATFSESVQAATISFVLRDPSGAAVGAQPISYVDSTRTATLQPTSPLRSSTTYTATVSGARDQAGNVMSGSSTWTFTTAAADVTPPTVTARTPASGATAVAIGSTVTATFSEAVQATSIVFALRRPDGTSVPASVVYDSATRRATLTPTSPLGYSTTYTASVSGAADLSGNVMTTTDSWSFTTAAQPPAGVSLWSSTAVPATPSDPDTAAVELGVKFRADVAGLITGIRFYKGTGNSGTHTGHLWSGSGTLLGTATFAGETATGWQQVNFATPVSIAANTVYVASYFAPVGRYAGDTGYFTGAGVDNGLLHALADGASGGNGVYTYGATSAFPTSTYQASNYWVDVVFSTGDTTPPTVTAQAPAPAASLVASTATATTTFSEPVQPGSLAFTLRGPGSTSVPASTTYDAAARTATLTPTSTLAASTTYTASVAASDLSGNAMSPPSTWSFTTAAGTVRQTAVADFAPGTTTGTVITADAGGELQLAPAFADDFTGTSLGAAWSATVWPAGTGTAAVTVAGGVASIGHMQVLSTQSYAPTAVEARLSIAAAVWQQFGLATALTPTTGNYSAVFTTMATTNTLSARVNSNNTITDVSLGAIPTGFHVYRVQPVSNGFSFYIDGALVATIARTLPAATVLKIALGAQNGTPALQADWVRLASYPGTGTYTSSVFDAGRTAAWGRATWTATLPPGTSLLIETSTADSANGPWSAWSALGADGTLGSPAGRYLRYRVTLLTSDPSATAVLSDVTFVWN
jgi:methionine-rich copper-binding protein CopC